MATNNEKYEDELLDQVETDWQKAISETEKTYDNAIADTDKAYQTNIDAIDKIEKQQIQLQQDQTDFTIEQIEQKKEQAYKDYQKEQTDAYTDWQKQINPYGANAERMAAMGLTGSGYSENSMVRMYNAYQNRVAVAKASYDQAVLSYDNAIKDAQIQNSSALAEIALNTFQQRVELSLQELQYKNQLLIDKTSAKTDVDKYYYTTYLDTLDQIQATNANSFNVVGGDSGGYIIKDGANSFTGSTRDEAIDFMTANGASYSAASGVKSKARWFINREGYNSYAEYLADYVEYVIERSRSKG